MQQIWSFPKDPDNRAVIFGILGFAWTVFIYFVPRPKLGAGSRLWGRLQSFRKPGVFRVVLWVSALATVTSFAYYIVLRVQPIIRVCEGQFLEGCAPHDVFVGCYGLDKFAKGCWHYKYINKASSRGGNMCGYEIHRVRCGDGFL
jgi:hypothetical protein